LPLPPACSPPWPAASPASGPSPRPWPKCSRGAVASALAEVFPWVRHLTAAKRGDFAAELIAALSDAAELAIDRTAQEVIAGWRATARIKADESLYPQALAPTQGDFGPVQALG
jgi:hypothetical protein